MNTINTAAPVIMPATTIAVIPICWLLSDSAAEEGEEGNGFSILGGAWWGANTLNGGAVLESFVSSLVIT
jgi:hypothetical protein